jgi:hypothetical protein
LTRIGSPLAKCSFSTYSISYTRVGHAASRADCCVVTGAFGLPHFIQFTTGCDIISDLHDLIVSPTLFS